jgi:hypothetical protein
MLINLLGDAAQRERSHCRRLRTAVAFHTCRSASPRAVTSLEDLECLRVGLCRSRSKRRSIAIVRSGPDAVGDSFRESTVGNRMMTIFVGRELPLWKDRAIPTKPPCYPAAAYGNTAAKRAPGLDDAANRPPSCAARLVATRKPRLARSRSCGSKPGGSPTPSSSTPISIA